MITYKVAMETQQPNILLFSGTSHPELAKEIADCLKVPLGKVHISNFPDGEISLQILESVRGKDTFVLQTVALDPNNLLVELLIMIDALKRASAKSIVVLVPYFGYARQDRRDRPRVPISAKLVANLLTTAGATHLVTMDLHAAQLEGFFDLPVDNLYARSLMIEELRSLKTDRLVVVAPDVGSIKIAKDYASHLGVDFAVANKYRISASGDIEGVMIIGDVKGKDVLLADDMCSTGSTLLSAAKACREKGAQRIFAVITHGLFVGDAVKKIEESPIELVYMANTIPTSHLKGFTKLKVVSIANLFGRAIRFIVSHESISSLFEISSPKKPH